MEAELIDLPQVCLEEIFKKLKFAEISRLGATCKYFREIAKTIFRLHFKNLEETIEAEMEKIETEANKPKKLSISDHLHLALLHSVLRILLSEAKMLKAHCWRYMREPTYDFCFPAGLILDEFEKILRNVKNKTLRKDMEPEITTNLFHLGETFYDYFDYKIENYFPAPLGMQVKITSKTNRQIFLPNAYNFVSTLSKESLFKDIHRYLTKQKVQQAPGTSILEQEISTQDPEIKEKFLEYDETVADLNEKTLFGVKILDILNCCASSDFHTLLFHNYNSDGFKLNSHYELRDINVLEALPTIGLFPATSEKQLNKICRYIRNNVRWTNLFHPLQDLWMLEDAIEINRNVNTASALLRQWKLQRTSSRLTLKNIENDTFQYDYRKILSQFKNRFGLLVTASLECPTLNNVPLKIQNYLKCKYSNINSQSIPNYNAENEIPSNINNKNIIHQIDTEKWNCNISTYKFHLELKIQYPSFLSETVKEAILKVDQVGEETIVTTQGDDIRKSATYRVDDENYD